MWRDMKGDPVTVAEHPKSPKDYISGLGDKLNHEEFVYFYEHYLKDFLPTEVTKQTAPLK